MRPLPAPQADRWRQSQRAGSPGGAASAGRAVRAAERARSGARAGGLQQGLAACNKGPIRYAAVRPELGTARSPGPAKGGVGLEMPGRSRSGGLGHGSAGRHCPCCSHRAAGWHAQHRRRIRSRRVSLCAAEHPRWRILRHRQLQPLRRVPERLRRGVGNGRAVERHHFVGEVVSWPPSYGAAAQNDEATVAVI